ncbi:hypothetical protein AALP_AA7G151800 [Arabis alpina]|uniref:Nucleolar 27S pre-rRNA processing Urb2/Npa2 C-terminal domain-containing protein n=1 Tax=Arabis alpina TaxID=50452 RepID=A0A087GI67_ARAAL|nr:hypothetical protein AALP_AA7G151800 [Arabis alpina]
MTKRKHTSPTKSKKTKKLKKNPKTQCVDSPVVEIKHQKVPGTVAEERPWENLQLILSLQGNELADKDKVELAFSFVKAHEGETGSDEDEECQVVKMSRVVIYLSDWVQKLLIPAEKNRQVKTDVDSELCLDVRCWEIFRFCLKQSSILHVSINLPGKLLSAIGFITEDLLSALNRSLSSEVDLCNGQDFEVYTSVVDCVGLLFSSKSGMSNDNLHLWFSTVEPVLKLTHKVLAEDIKVGDAFVLRFSCLVLEPFSKFLMTHPTKKDGFRDFLDKLFEPFLDVLGLLKLSEDKNKDLEITLIKLIQEILSLALFHSEHIKEFLRLGGTERYLPESKENKTILKSYHRHFFTKFENMLSMKKELELSCMGSLFRLFINRVMKQQRDSTSGLAEERPWKLQDTATNDNESSAKSHCSSSLRPETRKSLFDFFLHLMEPILLVIDGYVNYGSEMGPQLADFYCAIKSANSLLFHFAHERIYVKTEDASGGACFCFLRKIFITIVSVASKLQNDNTYDEGSEMHVLLAKELVTAIGYLLQIEYEVIESDLVNLWLIILSFLGFTSLSPESSENDSPFTSLLFGLGCQLINLYGDLRQVSVAVFALCKAVRLVIPVDGDNEEMMDTRELPKPTVFCLKRSTQSVEKLFSSQELRLAIHRAIKGIPEGQASGCIKSLTTDVSETMDWVRVSFSTSAREQDGQVAAFLAGALSDIYSLILDSLTITTGNSNLVGLSMNCLVDLIRPCLTHLVSSDSDCIENFFSAVTGKVLDSMMAEQNSETYRKSVCLFIVFFLRIYMSSRSLYRQVISLMPPKKSKEMAGIMGDFIATRCGNDWILEKSWNDEGYFSWICHPSASIVDIIKHISAIYLKDDSVDCSLLIYIFYGVALQRLVDLNRHIKSLDYVSKISDDIHGTMLKHVSVLKCEGEELTDFLLGNDIIPGSADVGTFETIDNTDQWVLRVSGISGKSLPAVRLWVLSQHIDIWCPRAGKKKLKNFLSLLISSSIPRILNGAGMSTTLSWENNVDKGSEKNNIGLEQFSLGLLCDSVLYEHEFVRRYLAPSFTHVLKTTAETFFMDFTEEVNFDSPPDWSEVLIMLESSIANQSEAFVEGHIPQLDNHKFTACQNLLNLLYGMPKEYMNEKSFQLYATYVLDFERFIVFSMLRCLNKLSPSDMENLFSLFITCRKTLKSIAMVSCDKVLRATELPLSDSSLLASWLFKSAQAAVTCQERDRNDFTKKSRDALFSLMDHTSYMILTVSKCQFSKALPLSDEQLIPSELSDGSGQANLIFKSLTEQAETLLNALRAIFRDEKTVFDCDTLILNKLAPIFSCFSGLLWGLASAVSHRDMQKKRKKKRQNTKLRWKSEQFLKLSRLIHVLSNFFEVFAQCLLLSGDVQREIQTNINWTRLLDGTEGSNDLVCGDIAETSDGKKKIIASLIKGDSLEVVLALRHLLIASAAILRLNLQIDGFTLSPTFVSVLTGISSDLLSVLADMNEVLPDFPFVWLDGAVKVIEELERHFCLSDPTLNRDLYSKFIELHLKVIGKCTSLQGKEATLESHETGFGTNVIHAKQVLSEKSQFHRLHWLDELKGRLRMSFKVFIHNFKELQLGVQAVERALVGVSEVCPAIYNIQTGNRDGGRISETAAAGIDCLDLILEHATGGERLNVVKKHIQGLLSAVFGIVAHMQSPFIFFTNSVSNKGSNFPDAGSVILMCVEVLIRIAGKHEPSYMDSSHIGQSIHIPGAIFNDYLQTTRAGFSALDGNLLYKNDQQQDRFGSSKDRQVDQKFSLSLYAACCRLLYTAVKHHQSETVGCMATLQESVSALLYCLETAGNKLGNRASWEVEEGIRCACFLRRIFEELRQQKDVYGEHCFKFLSTYIWVSSGYGPLKTGINREVDEALRPGVYALIDTCSPQNLQYLHTVFGEGPCRNSLATLQQDKEKSNFAYRGKV